MFDLWNYQLQRVWCLFCSFVQYKWVNCIESATHRSSYSEDTGIAQMWILTYEAFNQKMERGRLHIQRKCNLENNWYLNQDPSELPWKYSWGRVHSKCRNAPGQVETWLTKERSDLEMWRKEGNAILEKPNTI